MPSSESLYQVIALYPQLLHHEDDITKSPYNVSNWMLYLDEIDSLLVDKNKDYDQLILIRDLQGRRAVQVLPKSYKLWKAHWEFCLSHKETVVSHSTFMKLWEQALQTLHKFPRVWIEYLEYAHASGKVHPTTLRRLTNRCLEALAVTQHGKIWPTVLKYYQTPSSEIPKETKLAILRRYVQFNPVATKEVADFLSDTLGHWGEAALLYVQLLNQPSFTNMERKDLWMALAKICTRHPVQQVGLDFEAMTRAVLKTPKQFALQELEGVVWNQLADSFIRQGEFQLARSVYEEAIESVNKVRDFTILLDAYLQFEEGLLEATMQAQAENEEGEEEEEEESKQDNSEDDWDILVESRKDSSTTTTSMADLELALARAEDLTARRPLLLNKVLLRQNPHDVGEWSKRARLYKENEQIPQAAAALEEALQKVHARRAFGGNASQLVLELIKIYEDDCKDLAKARDLLDRICNQWIYEFKNVDDLAECHAAWVELELRQENWDEALDIIRKSVVVPTNAPRLVKGLAKSLRLWDLLLDLEESLGTMQTTKDAYNRAMEQRVATPMHLLNFGSFLTERKYFEESFAAYERAVDMFGFPGVKVIWKAYLEAFTKRYGGDKLERSRDLYHRCLEACPPEECADFFLMNGKFEEEYGLTKRALGVYNQMCQKVPASEKYAAYELFIAKTIKFMGQTASRDVYQSAIQDLEDTAAAQLCLDFAKMETSLKEMDRARAIFTYGAQMADPRRNDEFWKGWNEFEISHGNEETFREMLRIKRSVEASFSTVNYNAAGMSATVGKSETLSNEEAMKMIAEREGVELEPHETNKPIAGFVGAKRTAESANLEDMEEHVAKLRKATQSEPEADEDADEIDIDDLDEEEDVAPPPKSVQDVSTKAVPAAVFGGLAELANKKE
jgi:pre-mRNA-splicing factor SYF1